MTAATSTPPRPLRADAQRNRQRLLDVAHAAFVEHGIDTALDEIARTAGVGIGTLYRHFPTRDSLVEALIGDDIARLVELADELIAEDAADGVERWLAALIAHGITFRGLADSLAGPHGPDSTLGALCDRVHASGVAVVRHGQRRGTVRADVEPLDAVDLATSIAWLTEDDGDDGRRQRLLGIGLAGLQP